MFALRTIIQNSKRNWRQISTIPALHNVSTSPSSAAENLVIPGGDQSANPKLIAIVDNIASLSILEVSELSGLLKKKLNLPETAFMPSFAAAPPGAARSEEDDEEAAPKKVQTAFKVKLVKFDEKQKVALIKEIKNLLEGMNLVQAKKFVESAPTMVKEEIPKDEAEKLKEALTKVGATIEIE